MNVAHLHHLKDSSGSYRRLATNGADGTPNLLQLELFQILRSVFCALAYASFLAPRQTNVSKPVPKSSTLDGSGAAAGVSDKESMRHV